MLDAHVQGLTQETHAVMLSMFTCIFSEVHSPDFEYRWDEQAGLVGRSLFFFSTRTCSLCKLEIRLRLFTESSTRRLLIRLAVV